MLSVLDLATAVAALAAGAAKLGLDLAGLYGLDPSAGGEQLIGSGGRGSWTYRISLKVCVRACFWC